MSSWRVHRAWDVVDDADVAVVRGTAEGAYNPVYLGVIFLMDCLIEIIFLGLFLGF